MTQSPNPPPSLIALRIIWVALVAGPLMFAAVVLNITSHQQPKTLQPALLYVDIAWLAAMRLIAVCFEALVGSVATALIVEEAPPTHRGFGTRIMESIIGQLRGEVRFDWRDQGLTCEIALPLA